MYSVAVILFLLCITAVFATEVSLGGLRFLGNFQKASVGRRSANNQQKSLYFVSVNSAEWHTAQTDCKGALGRNATLVNLESPEEYGHLEELLKKTDATVSTFWTGGMYNIEKDSFLWGNGVEMGEWIPWDAGHPDSFHPVTKISGYFVGSLRLKTHLQTVTMRYMCELNNTTLDDEVTPCLIPNDLIVVVDASGSISPPHFTIALEFVEKLVTVWMETANTRVSVIIFSDITTKLFGLMDSEHLSMAERSEMILAAPHFMSVTNTDMGLDEALLEFQSSNRTSGGGGTFPKNVVLLTDGASTHPDRTLVSAQSLLDAGIRTVSVGIGDGINSGELLAVTGNNPEHVFTSDNFDSLLSLLRPVSEQIC